MKSLIYDKTQKGREEIATRVHQLPSRMRSLLVLIDGKQTDVSLAKKIPALGLESKHLEELLAQGFIQLIQDAQLPASASTLAATVAVAASTATTVQSPAPSTSKTANSANTANTYNTIDKEEKSDVSILNIDDEIADSIFSADEINDVLEESQTIFQQPEQEDINNINTTSSELRIQLRLEIIRKFLIGAIDEYLGFKGYFILRKVKKAQNFEDFHALRNSFVVAILRSIGKDKAIELRDEFDQLTYSRFSVDFPEFLDD